MELTPTLFSVEAEQSVLGSLMLSADAADRIGAPLAAEHFSRESHQRIYAAIQRLRGGGKSVDSMAVADELECSGELDRCGGFAYVVELQASVASAANIRRHAEIVIERAMLRSLRAIGDEIATQAIEPGMSAAEKVDAAQAKVMALTERVSQRFEPVFAREAIARQLERMQQRFDGTAPTGLSTGFADLDKRMGGGFHPGQLIIIAARPAMGKTAAAMQVALHFALHGRPTLFCSQEMPESDLMNRITSLHAGIRLDRVIDTKRMHSDDWDRMAASVESIADAPLAIDEQPALTLLTVRNKARRVAREYGRLGLLVVDYLQLMVGEAAGKARQNRNTEIEQISRGLKQLAKEMDMPVIALSQLNRDVEQRPNKRPMMSDMRDSGAIEQDADVILSLYRDEVYAEDSIYKGLAEVGVLKNRQGASGGFVPLCFRGEYTRFDAMFGEWPQDQAPIKGSRRRRIDV